MSNSVYPKALEAFLAGDLSWRDDSIRLCLVGVAYTYSDDHQFLSDVSPIVATSPLLTSKTVSLGAAAAADVTLPLVSGVRVESLVVFQDSGVASTSKLICHIDSIALGLPLDPTGGDVAVKFGESIFEI